MGMSYNLAQNCVPPLLPVMIPFSEGEKKECSSTVFLSIWQSHIFSLLLVQ